MDSKQGVQSSAEDSQGDSSDPDANADDDDEDDEDSTKQTRVYALARRPFVVVAGDQANSGGGTAQDGEIMQGDGTTQGEKPTHPLTTSNLETIQSNYNTAEENAIELYRHMAAMLRIRTAISRTIHSYPPKGTIT